MQEFARYATPGSTAGSLFGGKSAQMHSKRLGRVALGLAGALVLSACGGDDGGGGGGEVSQDTSQASGEVTFWDTSDAKNEAPKFKELIAKFQAAKPNIKVKYVNVPFSEAQEKFRTAAQGNSGAPDVLRSEVAWTPDFASTGFLSDLTQFVGGTEDYLPIPLSSNQLDGKLYGVPQVTDAPALLYNKAMLEMAGVEAPKTWADIQSAAAKIKSANPGVQSALFLQSGGYFSLPFIYSEGGDLLDVESKKISINSAESVKGLQDAVDLVKAGAAKADTTSDSYNNMMKAFKDGTTAMIINGPWSVADIKTGKAFKDATNLGIAPTPTGSSGKSGSPVGGHNYVIYSQSKVKDASAEFIKFMNSAESQAFLAKELGLLPTRRSAYELPDVKGDASVAAFKAVLDKATARPWIPEGGGLFAALDTEYPKALTGRSTPQAALDSVAKAWKSGVVTDYS
jgi:arabinogalactan oligomer / maltooligosaccharide transport system substrate-binding protein